jgi:hypothetical protein
MHSQTNLELPSDTVSDLPDTLQCFLLMPENVLKTLPSFQISTISAINGGVKTSFESTKRNLESSAMRLVCTEKLGQEVTLTFLICQTVATCSLCY